jgi:small conductance mechanosensitive channel
MMTSHFYCRANVASFYRRVLSATLIAYVVGAMASNSVAQSSGSVGDPARAISNTEKDDLAAVAAKVDVHPVALDEEIRKRLQNVLEATGWFIDPQVEVREGVVFLNGSAETDELKRWAGDLARNTQDVVAVANRLGVIEPSIWDFSPAWRGVITLWRDLIRSLPFLFFGLLVLTLSAGAGVVATRVSRNFLYRKVRANLLRNVMAWSVGIFVFLCGVYIILRVSGLTQLALTVVGGTGLVGLAVGIAFRDITENFLASIFLSVQRPFETGDLVEITDVTGYVQQLNVRTTVLMTLNGNLVQIPNASVYKNNLRNFSTNANRREDFVVGIGYDDPINKAQEVARKILADHPAILNDPEPSVLADSLGRSTVNLRVYFWINGREHSWLKVRSSVIRLIKRGFQEHGISMPDEAREVVFPHGIPVTVLETKQAGLPDAAAGEGASQRPQDEELAAVSTKAEAGLYSEAAVIEEQARHAHPLKGAENLLPAASGDSASGDSATESLPTSPKP